MRSRIDLSHFDGTDAREKLDAAMRWLRAHPDSDLYIAPGVYEISGEAQKQLFNEVIAGKYGENSQPYIFRPDFSYTRVMDFDGQRGTRVFADGATLLLDGFFEPVSLRNCENIELIGLTIDYRRKPYSKGRIVEATANPQGEGCITAEFREELSEHVNHPRHAVYHEKTGNLEFDPFEIVDQQKGAGKQFRFFVRRARKDVVGDELYLWHFYHSRPAVLIQNSKDVRLINVTICAQPGMGVVGHLSENLLLQGVSVVPSPGEHVSTNTDATHFASCRGSLTLENCAFEGQGDDCINVHTYYHGITPLGNSTYRLRCLAPDGTHSQAADAPLVGDRLAAVRRGTLDEAGAYRVNRVCVNADGTCDVALDRSLEENAENHYFANADACPTLVFSHCRARNHMARSVLIKTRRAVVEDCVFERSSGSAVVVSAEEAWGEGVSSQNVTIRNNVFIHCGAQWPNEASAIAVFTGSQARTGVQHGSVTIENNTILCPPSQRAIRVENAACVRMENNAIIAAAFDASS